MSTQGTKGWSSGYFIFGCDLEENLGVLSSANNAEMKVERVKQAVGGLRQVHSTIGNLSWAEADIEFNFGMSAGIFKAMQSALDLNHMRFNAFIHRCNPDMKVLATQELQNCMLTEWKMGALDSSKADFVKCTAKIQPESAKQIKGSGSVEKAILNKEFKNVVQSNFNVAVEGLDCTGITKVDGISVTVKKKEQWFGKGRVAEILPGAVEFPELTITMSAHTAQPWFDWLHEVFVNGQAGEGCERTVGIELLDHANEGVLAGFDILGCIPISGKYEKATANADTPDSATFKLAGSDMKANMYK